MKNQHKITSLITAGVIAVTAFGISFAYANNMPVDDTVISDSVNAESISSSAYIEQIDDYSLNINEFEVDIYDAKTSKPDENINKTNKYGAFSLITNKGKIKVYKLGDNDTSKKYLVKGTAKFSKKDITFDGYFLVDNTLTGNQKGQMTMYKGILTLPTGDKFDGYLTSGKYYYSGTYTWKNGQSYTGKFTANNKIGTSVLGENITSEYGTFYYDSTKKTYLFVRFVNGVPQKSGYYKTPTTKYLVSFDDKGNCISTSIVKS